MLRLSRVQIHGGDAGRAECGSDIHGNLPCFTHTRGDQFATTAMHMLHNQVNGFFVIVGDRYIHYSAAFLFENGAHSVLDIH